MYYAFLTPLDVSANVTNFKATTHENNCKKAPILVGASRKKGLMMSKLRVEVTICLSKHPNVGTMLHNRAFVSQKVLDVLGQPVKHCCFTEHHVVLTLRVDFLDPHLPVCIGIKTYPKIPYEHCLDMCLLRMRLLENSWIDTDTQDFRHALFGRLDFFYHYSFVCTRFNLSEDWLNAEI